MLGVELNGSAAVVFGVEAQLGSFTVILGECGAAANGLSSAGTDDDTLASEVVPKEKNFLIPPNILPPASLFVG